MSDNLNIINLVGRLGQDPELKYFESGAVRAKVSLAVSRNRRDEEPDWFNVEFWSKQAEIVAQYTTKGSLIAVSGEFKLEEWVDANTGMPRSKPVVRASSLELLSSNRSDNPSPVSQNTAATTTATNLPDF